MAFPTYDRETDTIQLNGMGAIFVNLYAKAKFADMTDALLLFHREYAELFEAIADASGMERNSDSQELSETDLLQIADTVFQQSNFVGWWSMENQQRVRFLRMAAFPYSLTDDQIEDISLTVDEKLDSTRDFLKGADGR